MRTVRKDVGGGVGRERAYMYTSSASQHAFCLSVHVIPIPGRCVSVCPSRGKDNLRIECPEFAHVLDFRMQCHPVMDGWMDGCRSKFEVPV